MRIPPSPDLATLIAVALAVAAMIGVAVDLARNPPACAPGAPTATAIGGALVVATCRPQ